MNKHTYIVQQLMSKLGLTYFQAVGAVGSLMQESHPELKHDVVNEIGATGIAQWLGDRKTDLRKYASSKGRSPQDFRLQVDFMIHELQGKESNALRALKQTKNYKEAAYVWTDKYERPNKSNGEYQTTKRENYALQAHKMIMGFPDNKKQIKMASITDNNSPAYAQAQSLSEAEKNRIIQQYKVQARLLKGKALSDYNDQMWKQGYIGYDEAGNWTGFVADGIEAQMTKNQKKANDLAKSQRIALRAIGEVMRDGMGQSNDGIIRVNPEVAETKLKAVINKLGKEFPEDLTVRKELDGILKSIPKDQDSRSFMRGVYDAITGKESSKKVENIMPFYNKIQDYYSKTSGVKVDLFKQNTINVNGPDGKVIKQAVPTNGKDIDFSQGYFRFSPTNGKGLNVEDPKVKGGYQRDIIAPNFNPALKPQVDAIEGIDNIDGVSTPTFEASEIPALTSLNYNSMLPDNEKKDDAANRAYNEKLRQQGVVGADKAAAERTQMTDEQVAEQERLNRISDSRQLFGLETPQNQNRFDADPSTFKSPIPVAELASGVIGIALGKSIADEEDVLRDEELNNAFMAHIYEQRRISEMGMNPTEEAAAKEAVANSYQLGYQNIVQNSSGNRALILGNLANLDNISSKRMSEIALKDVEIKQRASEEYGRAMEYVNNFNANKSIANNERKYQRAVLRNSQGTAIMAGAFKSMTDALGAYRAPNSAENMYMIHSQVKNMGWSPLVKDDGEGNNKWSYSWFKNQAEKTANAAADEETLRDKIFTLPQAEQDAFFEKTAGMTRNEQYRMAKQLLGQNQDNSQGQTNVVDESGNIISTENTSQNGATIPINKTIVQNSDGTQVAGTPMSKMTADGTTASTPQSPNEPTGISTSKNTIFDRMQPEPIKVENIRTSDGRTLNLQKDVKPDTTFGIAQNDDPNQIYAETLGLEDLYSGSSQISNYYQQFGNDDFERNQNIRNALNNTI